LKRESIIHGANPVREALRAKRALRAIHLARGEGGATRRIREEAERAGVKIVETTKDDLTSKVGHADHQGVVAFLEVVASEEASVGSILEDARANKEDPLLLLVDHVQDPHNLGAILRSAWALGAHGVVIPKNRAVQVTPAVVRVSAGAALHIPIVTVVNLKHAIEELKEANVWTAAAHLEGEPAHDLRLDGPIALVVGAEDKGVSPSIAGRCDLRVRIPLQREFDSLNASVAAGVLLYEVLRQRWARHKG
jgi:23S rRNA (guanosine2251-2'-O)-methyltransferase